jgi:hypothetical protein
MLFVAYVHHIIRMMPNRSISHHVDCRGASSRRRHTARLHAFALELTDRDLSPRAGAGFVIPWSARDTVIRLINYVEYFWHT